MQSTGDWFEMQNNADEYASDFLVNMSASADVLAQAKVEIDLSAIPEGKNVSIATVQASMNADEVVRSLSNGVASLSLSDTEPQTKSRKQKASRLRHYEIRKPMPIV